MKILLYVFWLVFGIGLAFIFLKSQSWSVKKIHPLRPGLSKFLIIGGAVIRWIIVFLGLFWSLSFSLSAMFLVFTVFMIARLFLLFKWQGLILMQHDNKNT